MKPITEVIIINIIIIIHSWPPKISKTKPNVHKFEELNKFGRSRCPEPRRPFIKPSWNHHESKFEKISERQRERLYLDEEIGFKKGKQRAIKSIVIFLGFIQCRVGFSLEIFETSESISTNRDVVGNAWKDTERLAPEIY